MESSKRIQKLGKRTGKAKKVKKNGKQKNHFIFPLGQ